VLEDAPPLEDLDHPAPDHLVGRQPVDPLAASSMEPLVTSPRSVEAHPSGLSVVLLPAPLAPRSVVMRRRALERHPLQHEMTLS